MVFGYEYDKSLWLMIKNDKKNREIIKDFIRNIPIDLFKKIYVKIEEYNRYLNGELSNKKYYFNGELISQDGDLYSFEIDNENGALKIGRHKMINGCYFRDMGISLMPYNNGYELIKNNLQLVGNMLYKEDFLEHIVNVLISNSLIGPVLISREEGSYVKKRIKKIDTKKIPDDYSIMKMCDK